VDKNTAEIIATAFAKGSMHDFQLFKFCQLGLIPEIECLADAGYQGLIKLHANSRTPHKKSKHHPLSAAQKAANRALSSERMMVEHVIGRLKVFRILSERYRNRRKRFGLRFNLIAAIHNFELTLD
jgi:IS5 family transposase